MKQCPGCRALVPDGQGLCPYCQTSLATTGEAPALAGSRPAADTCPNGHPVDPGWPSCPYCALGSPALERSPETSGEKRSSPGPRPGPDLAAPRKTRLEIAPGPPAAEPPPPAAATPPPPPGDSRRTVLGRVPGHAGPRGGKPPAIPRDLVAVLATPRLRPGGAVFPVRVGKTLIGAAPRCDATLTEDPKVSGEHALLLARSGHFYLADRMSTNGTWVDGQEVDPSGRFELVDRARIRCGETELLFLIVDPAWGGG